MSKKVFYEILDEINSASLLADFEDKEFKENFPNLVQKLKHILSKAEKNEDKAAILGFVAALEGTINDIQSSDEIKFNSAFEEAKIYLQRISNFSDDLEFQDDKQSTPQDTEENIIDDDILTEFYSNQKDNLDKIEELLLTIENGDLKPVASVKRAIHTIKGEAGLLGLFNVEKVCHKLEDFIENHLKDLDTHIDLVYKSRDWLTDAIDKYSQNETPELPQDLISELSEENTSKSIVKNENPPKSLKSTSVEPIIQDENLKSTLSTIEPTSVPNTNSIDINQNAPEDTPEKLFFEPHNPGWDEETIDLIVDFLQESETALANVDDILLNIETEGLDDDKINQLFRAFHTMKGVAGFLELSEIEKLAHNAETVLNRARKHELKLKCIALDVIFDSTEVMREMLEAIRKVLEEQSLLYPNPKFPSLLNRLQKVINGPEDQCGESVQTTQTAQSAQAPDLSEPKQQTVSKQKVEHLTEDTVPTVDSTPSTNANTINQPTQSVSTPKPTSTIKTPEQIAKNINKKHSHFSKIKETVKIDLERVDKLVEMIGELVIVESMVVNAPEVEAIGSQKIRNYINQLNKITRDLQDVGMMMRMVPVKSVFQKMARMVRDLSHKSGKKIKFSQSGETTEVDRNIVEHLNDPLVHMIRNAVDHGIETVEERIAAGKPPEGNVKLSAYHEGGKIIIEIKDDGKGLDKQAIRAKAIKQGLINEKDTVPDNDLYNLIFAPGFSTAKKVTEISGRGVGMDVVKKNIEQLRGVVMIETELGIGTTFKIVLPLTLAIIDGMLLKCGEERFLIPTLSIVESLKPSKDMISRFANKKEFINVRGEILPLIRLDQIFDIQGAEQNPTDALVMVVETYGSKVGVLVDDILKQQQVVIKSVGGILKKQSLFAGAAILSDGSVGLIINVEEIILSHKNKDNNVFKN